MYHHVYTTPHKCHQTKPSVVEDSCLNVLHHVVSWHLKEEVCGLADVFCNSLMQFWARVHQTLYSPKKSPLQITPSKSLRVKLMDWKRSQEI